MVSPKSYRWNGVVEDFIHWQHIGCKYVAARYDDYSRINDPISSDTRLARIVFDDNDDEDVDGLTAGNYKDHGPSLPPPRGPVNTRKRKLISQQH
jgi:hypothetical protein